MLLNPGKEFDFNGVKAKYPDVKMAYWVGGNPFVHHQDRNRMVAAWKKLETFIVQDFQWTPTARFADIVLPATTSYERNDIDSVGDYSAMAILAMKKVIDPVFESRTDYDIFAAISERLGKGKEFTEGKSEMDWIKSFYDAALTQAKAKKIDMPEFDAFWNGTGVVEFPVTSGKSFVRYAKFREDPLLEPLGTPSGKFEIYSKNIEKMGYDDCGPHPSGTSRPSALGGPTTKYKLHVVASHPKSRLHSQLCGTKLRDTYTVNGAEPCLINAKDAADRGIKDGDIVRVFNDRGQILAGAKVTEVDPTRRDPRQRGRLVRSRRARQAGNPVALRRRQRAEHGHSHLQARPGQLRPLRGRRGREVYGAGDDGLGIQRAQGRRVTATGGEGFAPPRASP